MHIEIMSKEAQGLPELPRTLLPVRSQNDRLGRRGGGRRDYDFSNSEPSSGPVKLPTSGSLAKSSNRSVRNFTPHQVRHANAEFLRGWTRFPDQLTAVRSPAARGQNACTRPLIESLDPDGPASTFAVLHQKRFSCVVQVDASPQPFAMPLL